jgi:hypothetical protein
MPPSNSSSSPAHPRTDYASRVLESQKTAVSASAVQRPRMTHADMLQVAVKQLDLLLADGMLDCTIGGLAATAYAAVDPVRRTVLSCSLIRAA